MRSVAALLLALASCTPAPTTRSLAVDPAPSEREAERLIRESVALMDELAAEAERSPGDPGTRSELLTRSMLCRTHVSAARDAYAAAEPHSERPELLGRRVRELDGIAVRLDDFARRLR